MRVKDIQPVLFMRQQIRAVKIRGALLVAATSILFLMTGHAGAEDSSGTKMGVERPFLTHTSELGPNHILRIARASYRVILRIQEGQFKDVPSDDLKMINEFTLDQELISSKTLPFYLSMQNNRGSSDEALLSASDYMLAKEAGGREAKRQIDELVLLLSYGAQESMRAAILKEARSFRMSEIDFRAVAKNHPEKIVKIMRAGSEKGINLHATKLGVRPDKSIINTAAQGDIPAFRSSVR